MNKKLINSNFCILILALALFLFIFSYFNTKTSTNNFTKQYSFLNPSVSFIDKKDLLVNFRPLQDLLIKKYQDRNDYMVSLYFEYLPTGANISINKDEKVWPASLIKVPISMAVMKKIETGEWKLSNELVILDEDKDNEYGEFYLKPTGTTVSIEELLNQTLKNSDNTTYFVLLRNLENKEIEDVYNHLGLDDIIDSLKTAPSVEAETDNRITAKRYSIFFRSLYNSTYLKPEHSQLFLNILKNAPCENLCKGLPSDIEFVHKTGIRTDKSVNADSGIVYAPNRPYLLTVMIQKKSDTIEKKEEIDKIFTDISKEVYDYVYKAK